MKTYINIKANYVETIDEINSLDYPTIKEYKQALKSLLADYVLSYRGTGIVPYKSSRPTKDWANK